MQSGPWNGQLLFGIPSILLGLLNGLSLIDDQEAGTISFMFSDGNSSLIHLVLNVQGNTKDIIWNYDKNNWEVMWKAL